MSTEIDLDEQPAKTKRPYFLTFVGLLTIAGLISLPFVAGEPDGDKMPDIVRYLGHFHPFILHLPIGIFVLILCQEFVAMFSRHKPYRSILPAFLGAASAVIIMLVALKPQAICRTFTSDSFHVMESQPPEEFGYL